MCIFSSARFSRHFTYILILCNHLAAFSHDISSPDIDVILSVRVFACLCSLQPTFVTVSIHCQLAELLTTCCWVCLWAHFSERIAWREKTPPVNWGPKLNAKEKGKMPWAPTFSFSLTPLDVPHFLTFLLFLPPCNDEMNLLKSWTKIKAFLKLLFRCIFFIARRKKKAYLCFWIVAFHSKEF